ncbi:hypothetical protein P175DRAFT_0559259 [Aspergillus ochraceoroseus IBT 24754]|uniref:Uncharacterized protein n=1 Tax=Aspergillus ochraceoroseus IBT 24754 TaxID=1392256 RepID=A0A2T5LTU4_9EURO|nr:uncharacterized protein P175DRAFT_0559259 [Aspergillus ochraceoroseus IBT 24754]PTU19706.1 hypothetical protein P175DRAFT_0559259 [Aspergillus ochraceoroseus IBT 24754]
MAETSPISLVVQRTVCATFIVAVVAVSSRKTRRIPALIKNKIVEWADQCVVEECGWLTPKARIEYLKMQTITLHEKMPGLYWHTATCILHIVPCYAPIDGN